ncbi:PREDICTED: salivary glue protein Sgs-5 [Drosophila arizonae]|uniref:Salivary glue protein Sgs-5 n=1 Tax=Drosophila arizonae TaxID=7263 RepID=A0ABM1Q335_DROAR|nr:PREDICTED: salivary glue protein Sgs-5 [Drosophila arizonae]
MCKLSFSIALCAVFVCLSTALSRCCPRKCELAFRCDPFYREPVWSIVDGFCRGFQNSCIFESENCNRVNSCRRALVRTTREACKKRCVQICPLGGSGVCATFADTSREGARITSTRTFLNRCLLDQHSCVNGIPYIGVEEGECRQ